MYLFFRPTLSALAYARWLPFEVRLRFAGLLGWMDGRRGYPKVGPSAKVLPWHAKK